jgi:uncharacterized protein (UPF0297 family)
MEIEINLSDEQKKRLKNIFSFVSDYQESEVLESIIEAAKEEYLEQFLSDGTKTTVTEIRQYKLFLLVKHVFKGKIPSEIEVASIFKMPISSSRSLIRNMRSRYQFEIENYLKDTIKDILSQITDNDSEDGYFHLKVRSSYMLSEMNQIIENKDQNCEKIKRLNDISSVYKISESSKALLDNYINE